MRPLLGDDAWVGRQRSADNHPSSRVPPASANQMSFFLADEVSVDSYLERPTLHPRFNRDTRKPVDSASDQRDNESSVPLHSPLSRASNSTRSPSSTRSQNQPELSRPMTPILLNTSCTASALSSPSSRRNSVASSLSDHVASFNFDDEPHDELDSAMLDSGNAPQLVMPSIKMPSRRPFTDVGRQMGRLKIMVAGDSGIGKTSLIKAIVQTCEHIVHVDPISSRGFPGRTPCKSVVRAGPLRRASSTTSGACVSEIYASTRSFPEWWSELDESRPAQRRKSLGDSVLERNICFVDTSGYGTGSSAMETIVPCVEYVESFLDMVSSDSLSDSDMLNMLGGDGGCRVDAVLYLLSDAGLKPTDMEYIRRLSRLTNVIPILAKADTVLPERLLEYKRQVAGQLDSAGLRPFGFTSSTSARSTPSVPYCVSSANVSDHDIMDASLLMSPDYVQPLMATELGFLVDQIFSANGSSWLRHAAARKYMEWRDETRSRPRHLYRPLDRRGQVSRRALSPTAERTCVTHQSMALARVPKATGENTARHFHVVDWAGDLQRSLAGERSRNGDGLSNDEHVIWLNEQLDEGIHNGTLVTVDPSRGRTPPRRRGKRHVASLRKAKQRQDPLGLLQVAADLKARGWIALEVLGSISVLGGFAFWLSSSQHWQIEW
ncbi:Septin-domain-containing protein [Xylariomycetidae sp. FL2044]|nr:Septin-domain-containing protein [Xylariomycetidae sp. FL2044]